MLAERHTVVPICGATASPRNRPRDPTTPEYGKRAMVADQVALMARLGFDRFAAVGRVRH